MQFDLVSGYGDDSSAIQASNGGVPVVNIVVPVRYTHAHNGVMDRYDFDRTAIWSSRSSSASTIPRSSG
jgi:endoglucanase